MIEYVGDCMIEDNTGKSDSPFWVYVSNGFEYVAQEYFRTYEAALEWAQMRES